MSLPDVPERGGASLRFRVGPVPVSIHVSSPIVLGLLGFGYAQQDLLLFALWIVIGIVSIVVHELAHAAVVHLGGGQARVDLQWLGGLTRYRRTERLSSRPWSVAVSLAGPGIGIAIGLLLRAVTDDMVISSPYVRAAIFFAWFVSFWWGVFNLLPVMPLDGGQALRDLLPGTPARRTRRAAVVGAVIGGATVVLAASAGQPYVAVLFALLAWRNVQLLRGTVDAPRARPLAEDHPEHLAGHVAAEDLRRRARVGEASEAELVAAVREAARDEDHLLVVELVNMALGHGATDARLPWQAARSWAVLDQRDRANRMVRAAMELGAPEEQLVVDPALRPLHDHPRWPLAHRTGG